MNDLIANSEGSESYCLRVRSEKDQVEALELLLAHSYNLNR